MSATDAAALSALVLDQPAAPIAVEIELVFRESAAQALVARQMVMKAVADVGGKVLHVSRHPQFSSDAMLVELPAAHVDLIVQRSEDSLAGLEPIIAIGPQTSISMSSATAESHEVHAPDQRPGREPLAALFDAVPHLKHDLLVERMQFDDPAGLDAISIGHRLHGTAMASLIIHGDLNDLESVPITRPLYVRPVMYARHANSSEEVFPPNRLVIDDFYDAVVRMKEGSADVPPSAPTVIIVNVSLGDSRRRFAGRLSRWARAIDELSWRYGILFDDMFNPGTDLELQEDKDAVYNGKYTPVTISVACFVEGFRLGDDALGGVLISEPNDIQQTINEYSMVANALSDCRDSLLKLVNLVTKV